MGTVGFQERESRHGGVGIDFVFLANSTSGNIFPNIGGHPWPPKVLLEQVEDAKYTTMSTSLTGMDG